MVTDPMNCREFVELVTDYIEGALPASAHARMELHRRGCQGCATYLEQMRMTIRLLGTMGSDPAPDRIADTLLRVFRRLSKTARRAHVYDLGSPARAVSPGSHLVQYYGTQEERDEFADQYVAAGLRAGEACVILGDPAFVQQTAERVQAEAEPHWPGQLYTAAWDRPPSPEAVRDFVDLHSRLNTRGPVDLLPEVRLPGAVSGSPARGVRGLGNFQHWSGTPEGSRYLLQICASVHDSYLRSRDIVVCQYAVANRPAALRWGGLAVHTHVVDGTCLADPMAVLERSVEDGIAKMTDALAGLEDAVAAGRISETLQTLRRARSGLGDMRELLRRLHVFDPVDRR
jgi:hypothetical protein